ncbi:hypothetical protein HaLaN_15069 [Haematococcus lacustris]|uniref:Uncharacterized protein n=1 Tax=Haematococcus lacustris TaxID=44745 RepID=A0A699ZHE8_HAELA|nr:hypothetical protein HaLaN_15069 [Haematococcus lacustris]
MVRLSLLVDEHRTSRVSSAVNGKQPCEVELNTLSATRPAGWKPTAGQVEERLAPRSGQAATQPAASEPGPSTPPPAKRSKPAAEPTKAEPGAAEPTKGKGKEQGALPAKGKEYPGLGYKRLRDKPPQAQQQQQPAEAQ